MIRMVVDGILDITKAYQKYAFGKLKTLFANPPSFAFRKKGTSNGFEPTLVTTLYDQCCYSNNK